MPAPASTNASPKGAPAARRIRPRANIMGATVGRGISSGSSPGGESASRSLSRWFSIGTSYVHCHTSLLAATLSPCDVDHREDDQPDDIHEVPVPGNQLDAATIHWRHEPAESQSQHGEHYHDARRHVQSVKADESVISGPEQITAWRQTVIDNQRAPLKGCSSQKDDAEQNRGRPPAEERRALRGRFDREVDGDAAGKQA